jgi:hypothetical protein
MNLNYETREKPPAHLHLESNDNLHTLTFPLSPAWLIYFSITVLFALTAIHLILAITAFRLFNQFLPLKQSPPIILILMPAFPIIGALFYALLAFLMLRSHRRHGHLPRSIWIDTAAQTLGHRHERTPRHRLWPLQNLTHLRVTNIPNLAGLPLGYIIKIRVRGRLSPLHFRCPTEHQNSLRTFFAILLPLIPNAKVKRPSEAKSLIQEIDPQTST